MVKMAQTQNGPGSKLRDARENLGLSQRDIADSLKLPIRFIVSIDNDVYEDHPGITFYRGYLKSYARIVEVPVDEIVTNFDDYSKVEEPVQIEKPAAPKKQINQDYALIAAAGFATVIFVTILYLILR